MDEQKLTAYTQYIRQAMQRREDAKKEQLVAAIGILRNRMERLLENLADGSSFNSLGEIQGLGAEIDRLTGELAVIRKIKDDTRSMLSEAMI
ncbi:MAG TPA: hypothetical protein VFF11_04725, partial [Candidatus Binatia bacterium]|nr:hypothetical protein [Candidatus Binatia bacterium]